MSKREAESCYVGVMAHILFILCDQKHVAENMCAHSQSAGCLLHHLRSVIPSVCVCVCVYLRTVFHLTTWPEAEPSEFKRSKCF